MQQLQQPPMQQPQQQPQALVPGGWGQPGPWGQGALPSWADQAGAGACQMRQVTQWQGPQGTGMAMTQWSPPPVPQPKPRFNQPAMTNLCSTVTVEDPNSPWGNQTSVYCLVCDMKLNGDYAAHLGSNKHTKAIWHINHGANPRVHWEQVIPAKYRDLGYLAIACNQDFPGYPGYPGYAE